MSILIYFATIFWSLFPNLIHVFQGGDNFINKVNATNLVENGDFSDGLDGWIITNYTLDNNSITADLSLVPSFSQENLNIVIDNKYYINLNGRNNGSGGIQPRLRNGANNISDTLIFDFTTENANYSGYLLPTTNGDRLTHLRYGTSGIVWVNNVYLYNVTEMIVNGVKNDNGILFSDLTDLEIQNQLDLWITEYGSLNFIVTKDNTTDQWFDTGFIEKTAERDFLDYLGYFVWLLTPPIILFATLNLLRRVI